MSEANQLLNDFTNIALPIIFIFTTICIGYALYDINNYNKKRKNNKK